MIRESTHWRLGSLREIFGGGRHAEQLLSSAPHGARSAGASGIALSAALLAGAELALGARHRRAVAQTQVVKVAAERGAEPLGNGAVDVHEDVEMVHHLCAARGGRSALDRCGRLRRAEDAHVGMRMPVDHHMTAHDHAVLLRPGDFRDQVSKGFLAAIGCDAR